MLLCSWFKDVYIQVVSLTKLVTCRASVAAPDALETKAHFTLGKWTRPIYHPPNLLLLLGHFFRQPSSLALEDRGAGVLVRGRDGPVDVDQDTGVRGLVRAREGDLVGRLGAAATGDLNLGAADVELGTT